MENSNITDRSENIRGEAASADKGMAADGEATSVKASSVHVHDDTSAQPEPESLVSAGAAAPRGNQAVSRAAVLQPRDQAAVSQAAVAQGAAPATNQQRAPGADGAAKSTALHGAMPLKAGGRIVLGNDRQKASPGAGRKGAASKGQPQSAAVPPPQAQPSGVMPPLQPPQAQQAQTPQPSQPSAAVPPQPHIPQQSQSPQQSQPPQAPQPHDVLSSAAGADSEHAPVSGAEAAAAETAAREGGPAAGAAGQQGTDGTPGASSQVGKAALDAIAHAARQEAAMGGGQGEKERTMGPLRPSDVDFMPGLLRSLAVLLRLRGKVVSPQFLMAGLTGNKVTPQACLRAARKAGLSGRIVFRPELDEIPSLVLPCILLLTHDRSCVMTSIRDGKAEVIFPETSEAAQTVQLEDLKQEYSGYTLFAAVEAAPDDRAERLSIAHGKRWFWDVLRYYAPIYRHVALASVVINLIAVGSPLFVMNVYDRVVPNNAIETLWVLAIGIIIIYMFNFLLSSLRTHFVDVAGRNADIVLSSSLVEKVLSMRMDAKPESTGALVNNLREFEQLREFFSSSSLLACIDLPFLVIFLLLTGFIGGPLVFLPIAAMPLMLGLGLLLQQRSRRSAEASYKQNMQKNALLVEIVGGLETLKSCMAESRMQKLWESVVGLSAQSNSEARKYNNLAVTVSMLITQLVTVAMIVWGVYRISEGLMTMGALIGCNILVGRTMAPLLQMASLLTRLQNSHVTLKALDMLMLLPSENQVEKTCMDFGMLRPSFTMESVSFAYPHQERLALERVSLRIEPGERVGIIGPMGSGKSTLSKLLIGLYQPKEGAVKFGDVDIRQIPSTDLRGRIGVLPQDVVLFYGSIRDNIALGDPTINDHLILRAAALAGVTDFLRNNPAGFAAQVGEQGRALSGGQRQAVALARALVRDPEVLLLDEPTSNMDTDSELMLQKRLFSVMQDRTVVLVTHRLSMLRIVERLIVMENGQIKMDGPRDAVLQSLRDRSKQNVAAARHEHGAEARPAAGNA
ncbi:MAG: type I secretion system permease/ATPase [Desulfovibrio sp.]|nr:type I secretion system permease/ATPase [Desulfovibrio sp.]MDY0259787.1 type I secretion system permease/ATPase [Desulfovibrio sp.]